MGGTGGVGTAQEKGVEGGWGWELGLWCEGGVALRWGEVGALLLGGVAMPCSSGTVQASAAVRHSSLGCSGAVGARMRGKLALQAMLGA